MTQKTPLYPMHIKQAALMVDFAGWQMPLHYGSQIEEHHSVRNHAGMFDVSHMGILEIQGEIVQAFLRYLLPNNIDKAKAPGSALYTCLLNENGGVIDDLIVYYISPTHYRLIVNASRTEVDFAWIRDKAKQFSDKNIEVKLNKHSALIAVQGPLAVEKLIVALETYPHLLETDNNQKVILNLKPFHFIQLGEFFIARTGYTGEKGFEIMLPADMAIELWEKLSLVGVRAIGLGARDTLRLEAGFNLYGQDMNESVTPLESNLQWTISFQPKERDFIGRQALEAQLAQGVSQKLVGIKLLDKGVLRPLQNIIVQEQNVGIITSGTFSPTLKQSIGLARIQSAVEGSCLVHIRDKNLNAQIVVPPFVRR